jgi:hypothetical protein
MLAGFEPDQAEALLRAVRAVIIDDTRITDVKLVAVVRRCPGGFQGALQ